MNPFSKLMLSADELQLVTDTSFILTKRKVIDTVYQLLGLLQQQQKLVIKKEQAWLPPAVVSSEPKIARGENYLQLPYVLLDYPRCFGADNIFAVRTLFWWGNFFSITLHLSGMYKQLFQQKIIENISISPQDIFICIHENQWHHHFEADNYIAVKECTAAALQDMAEQKNFIKLAIKFPLQSWEALPARLDAAFVELVKLLKS